MKAVKSCRACFAAYTELAMSTVKQSQAIPFTGPYSLLVCHLRNLTGKASSAQATTLHCLAFILLFFVSGDVEELDGTEKNTLKVFKTVTLIHQVGMVLLEVSVWSGYPAGLQILLQFQLFMQHLFTTSGSPWCVQLVTTLSALHLSLPFASYLLFQWIANPLNDMYADAIATVVLEVQSNPKALKGVFLFMLCAVLLQYVFSDFCYEPDLK